jgi:L-ascorbate metabolism protein UlaG (beta-lactamase superfamily)
MLHGDPVTPTPATPSSDSLPVPQYPPGTRFRRAEGLLCEVSLCRPDEPIRVLARRQGGDRTQLVSPQVMALLGRLNRWRTADELGVPPDILAAIAEADLAFWSKATPKRVLTNASLPQLKGPIAFARNLSIVPLLKSPEANVSPFPFMPRRGWLDRAVLIGAHFSLVEMETSVISLNICCCERHAALIRDVVPKLTRGCDADMFSDNVEAQRLLAILNMFAMLEGMTREPFPDGQVTWLGHAGLLYAAGGARILIDPMFPPRSLPSRRPDIPVHAGDVGEVSAILITHGDNDHLNAQSLFRFPRNTPLVIPKNDVIRPYQVDMKRMAILLGFTDIREVAEWERLQFGEAVVIAAPFRGEDWGLELSARTYLVSSSELTIYANADSTSSPDVYMRLAKDFRIDLALLGISGASEAYAAPPGFGYGEFYTPWIQRERRNEWVQLCNDPEDSAAAAVLLGARHAFGYAAGGASCFEVGYSDRGTHEEFATILEQHPMRPQPLAMKLGSPVMAARLREP